MKYSHFPRLFGLALAFFLLIPNFSYATPADDAREALKVHIDEVMNFLKDPAFSEPATREEIINKINDEILQIFDFTEFASRTVGKKWLEFSEQQKENFIDAFAELLRATYIEKLDKYDGQSVSYTGGRTSKDGTKVEIQTSIYSEGKDIPVFYQMLKKDEWIVYDVRIEGMSLVENYRSQFAEIFQHGSTIDELIAQVRKLAENMRKENRKVS